MSDERRRIILTAIILLAAVGFVAFGSDQRPPARAEVRTSVSAAAPGADPTSPWASEISAATPLVKFVAEHPSPVGKQAVDALEAHKAVILVGLQPGGGTAPEVLGWIKDCSTYCRMLGTRIDLDPSDPQEKELLGFLQAGDLPAPFLVGLGMNGEVKQKVSGKLTRKQVIGVFADVTGSCGVECESGQCG